METVEQITALVPAWQGAHQIETEPIGGLTNTNYRVTVDGEPFVLRVSGPNTARLGINREAEWAALRAAAAAGLGPPVEAFLLPEGHLVTRWVEGEHWEAARFRTPENVRRLTETARRIHNLPPNGVMFSPFQRVSAFMQTALSFAVPMPPGLENLLNSMQAVERDQKSDTSDWRRFCHNDLVSVNYLVQPQTKNIVVLDWEFAGLGDIYYDLATVVYTHDSDGPISPELEDVMLAYYFGRISSLQRRRLQGMKFMLMLFTGMWGLAQHGMQQAGLIPAPQGFDYLEFAGELFERDIRETRFQYECQIDV